MRRDLPQPGRACKRVGAAGEDVLELFRSSFDGPERLQRDVLVPTALYQAALVRFLAARQTDRTIIPPRRRG
jgi:hypothetical protein